MNDIRRIKEHHKDTHPALGSYLDCMTRSLFTGLATFCLSFSGLYFGQKLIPSRYLYPLKINILVSSLVSCGIAYKVTSDRTKSCQAAWMAAEDKHTIIKEGTY